VTPSRNDCWTATVAPAELSASTTDGPWTVLSTEPTTAAPRVPPTSRTASSTADPAPASSERSAPMTASVASAAFVGLVDDVRYAVALGAVRTGDQVGTAVLQLLVDGRR
jgi:hypothetical protein